MTFKIVCGLFALSLAASSAALADPATEKQVEDSISAKLSSENPHFAQVKSDSSGEVCGYVTVQDQNGQENQLKFLSDSSGANVWLEGRNGADPRAVKAADRENFPKWRACHK